MKTKSSTINHTAEETIITTVLIINVDKAMGIATNCYGVINRLSTSRLIKLIKLIKNDVRVNN